MALSISLSLSISTDRQSQTLTDLTTYGGSNPARAACRVFCTGYKVDYNNSATALTTTGDTSDPSTDASWAIDYTIDGFYRYNFVIVEDAYSAGTTYAQYDAVYSGNDVYRSVVAGNIGQSLSDPNYWEPISNPSDLAANKNTTSESLNITSLQYLRVLSADGQYDYANRMSDQCACSSCDDIEALQWYNLYAMLLDQLAIADSRSETISGELLARRVESEFINCTN